MMEPPPSGSDRIAELLSEDPELDELTRARMEKNLLLAVSSGEHHRVEDVSLEPSPFDDEDEYEDELEQEKVAAGMGNVVSLRRRRMAFIAGGTVMAAAAAVAIVYLRPPAPSNDTELATAPTFLRYDDGETVGRGPLGAGDVIGTADGERVEVRVADARVDITPESDVRFDRLDSSRVDVYLSRGAVEVELHPERRGDQTLRVSTESTYVDVVGTVFRVAIDEKGDTVVSTVEGTVRVTPRSEGAEPRFVRAGQETTVVASADDSSDGADEATDVAELEAEAEGEEEAGEDTELVAEETTADPTPLVRPRTPTISERIARAEALIDAGEHDAGRTILESLTADSRGAQRVRAHTLLAESFAADGRLDAAAAAYADAVDAGGHSMGAQNALFAMGRLYERRVGDRPAAIAAYRQYLETAPTGAHAVRVERALCNLGESEHCP